MAFEKLRTIVITAIPKPKSRERFRKIAETTPTSRKRALRTRILGATGMTVITQLSSFFLVCIGVQIAWNGVKALLESVTLHFG